MTNADLIKRARITTNQTQTLPEELRSRAYRFQPGSDNRLLLLSAADALAAAEAQLAGTVKLSVYESAVKGRQDFRSALKECRSRLAAAEAELERVGALREAAVQIWQEWKDDDGEGVLLDTMMKLKVAAFQYGRTYASDRKEEEGEPPPRLHP